MERLAPFELRSACADEVFERLYPLDDAAAASRAQWIEARDEFGSLATEVNGTGERVGLAVLGQNLLHPASEMKGVVVLNGFRADGRDDFIGYMAGKPSRASRDDVEVACTAEQLTHWITSQVERLRERDRLGPSMQLELSELLYRATGALNDDHHIAMTSDGLTTVSGVRAWARDRGEIFFSYGWPCDWETRPPALWHRHTRTAVALPEGWLVPYLTTSFPFLDRVLPRRRDTRYEQHKWDQEDTWKKRWWLASDLPEGLVFKLLCEAWSCELEDLLAPVAKRGWNDVANLGIPEVDPAPVLRLRRP